MTVCGYSLARVGPGSGEALNPHGANDRSNRCHRSLSGAAEIRLAVIGHLNDRFRRPKRPFRLLDPLLGFDSIHRKHGNQLIEVGFDQQINSAISHPTFRCFVICQWYCFPMTDGFDSACSEVHVGE